MYENFWSAGILNGFPCVVHHSDDRVLNKTSQNFSLILLNLEAKLGISFKNVACLRELLLYVIIVHC